MSKKWEVNDFIYRNVELEKLLFMHEKKDRGMLVVISLNKSHFDFYEVNIHKKRFINSKQWFIRYT
jgi:hypothetical protein